MILKILDYLRLCLWYSAAASPDNPKDVSKLNAYIRRNYEATEDNFIHKYLMLVKQILVAKRGNVELLCIYDLLNSELGILNQQCHDIIDSLASSLKDVSECTRIFVAKSIGILWAIGSSLEEFNSYVSEFVLKFIFANPILPTHYKFQCFI